VDYGAIGSPQEGFPVIAPIVGKRDHLSNRDDMRTFMESFMESLSGDSYKRVEQLHTLHIWVNEEERLVSDHSGAEETK